MPLARTFQNLTLSLEIDGADAGALTDVSGGDWRAEVVAPQAGGSGRKRLGQSRIEPIVMTVTHTEPGALWTWVADALAGTQTRRSGAVVFSSSSSSDAVRLEWLNGAISKVVLPAGDAASKDPTALVVEVTPERATWAKTQSGQKTAVKGKFKATSKANFALDVSGLPALGGRTAAVSAVTVTIAQQQDAVGEHRVMEKALSAPEVSDFAFTFAGAGVKDASDWFEDVVVDGNSSAAAERTASVTFLDAALKTPLIAFELRGVLPFRRELSDTPFSTGAGSRIELHCCAAEVRLTTPSPAVKKPAAPAAAPAEAPATIARTIDPSAVIRPARPTPPG